MAGIRFDSYLVEGQHGPQTMMSRFKVWQKKMEVEVREAVASAAEQGAELMQFYIASRGTAHSGKQGRVETWDMHDEVAWRRRGGGGWAHADFGWIDNEENYYGLQEDGFYHVWARRHVEGMFAFADAWVITEDALTAALHRIVP